MLDEKQIDFAITCDAPAKVAIAATSGRGQSAVNNDGTLSERSTNHALFGALNPNIVAVGLGMDGSKGVGGYSLRLTAGTLKVDGVSVDSIAADGGTTS